MTDYEKTNFTVVLTCIANRTKLSFLIIFKLKNILRGNFSLLELIQKDGWMKVKCFTELKIFGLSI